MTTVGNFGRGYALAKMLSKIAKQCRMPKSSFSAAASNKAVEYGILCDVDGVLTRGRSALAAGSKAFELLHDEKGNWRVPVLFLTNAGNALKQTKAAEISEILKCEVSPSEIVMSHTALRLYSNYFDKHVAICGHGPIKDIARNIGFKNCSTIEEISEAFPWLDACKPKQHIYSGAPINNDFEKIEAIVLFGEPERWEHSLQIIIDLLIQNGDPNKTPEEYLPLVEGVRHSHIPVFACSSDLVWASGAPSPRIAHGSFLVCLEALYERMSGQRLNYTGLIGKPSPTTYTFALSQMNAIAAKKFGAPGPLKRVYCIGDNPEVDVYGANLYNLCLQSISDTTWKSVSDRIDSLVQDEHPHLFDGTGEGVTSSSIPCSSEDHQWKRLIEHSAAMPQILRDLVMRKPKRIAPCTLESILVLTGVYQDHHKQRSTWHGLLNPCHQVHHDFPELPHLCEPSFVATDVEEAVRYILALEGGGRAEDGEVRVTRCCPYLDEVVRSP